MGRGMNNTMAEDSVNIEMVQEFIRDLLEERDELKKENDKSEFTAGIIFEINEILTRIKTSLCSKDSISEMEEMDRIY